MGNIQQREELHRTIWAMADGLRGQAGGWEFKAYVLGTLFYRFISENLTTSTSCRLMLAWKALIMQP